MICRNCGAEGEGNFCSNCGSPFKVKDPESQIQEPDFTSGVEDRIPTKETKGNQKDRIKQPITKNKKRLIENSSIKKDLSCQKPVNNMRQKSKRRRKKRKSFPRLPSLNMPSTPKVMKKTASKVLQGVSAVFMAFIFAILLKELIEKRATLGSLSALVAERNYALALFIFLMGMMLCFSFFSFFWILSKKRIGSEKRIRTFDSGRGLFSFISFGMVVLAAPQLLLFFPTGHESLTGLKLTLEILSDCGKILWSFAVFGTIACLVRRFMKV